MTLFSIPVMYWENAVEGKVFVCLRLVVLFNVVVDLSAETKCQQICYMQ